MCAYVGVYNDHNNMLLKILNYLWFPLAPVMDLDLYRSWPWSLIGDSLSKQKTYMYNFTSFVVYAFHINLIGRSVLLGFAL